MKYIVYKTTNIKNNYIYIGVHKSYTDSFDGYLGCGVNINKETSYSNPSTKFQKAVLALMGKNVDELYYYSFIHANSYKEARVLQIQNREVHKYNSNGSYICSYDSQLEAEEDNPGSNITKSIQTSLEDDNGFKWSLFKREQIDCATKKYKRKVGLYSDSGELLKVWESARACCREVGGAVQNVLNGKYKKHKGNIYKYIDN